MAPGRLVGKAEGMKLLLTSGGITNDSIRDALISLLDKPIGECRVLLIPSAEWGHPSCTPESALDFLADSGPTSMKGLGCKSVGLLELTALPGIDRDRWVPWVRDADILLADGGEATYFTHWMRESGLAELLPTLGGVWVGVSAGSMALTPRIGADFAHWAGAAGDDRTLGIVDFSIFPHLDYPDFPENTMADAERWAAGIGVPSYALDDQSAVVVDGASVEVVSEGHWRAFDAQGQ